MIERIGPGPKKRKALNAVREAQAQYLKLLRTFEALRIPVAKFLMETKVCAENTRMPLGDDLLAALRRANDHAHTGAPADPANPAGAGGSNGAGSSQPG
jgi:hypothetical protein